MSGSELGPGSIIPRKGSCKSNQPVRFSMVGTFERNEYIHVGFAFTILILFVGLRFTREAGRILNVGGQVKEGAHKRRHFCVWKSTFAWFTKKGEEDVL